MQGRNQRSFIETGGNFRQAKIIGRHGDRAHRQGQIKGNRPVKSKFCGIFGKHLLPQHINA